jgi:protein-L-isoaspartate O-methyltransferase
MTETELLAHYVARGGEPWNVSLEAAWLDYELRAWFRPRLPARWPCAVMNVGIGVGLWDDWLGHELGVPITSVDRDPEICRTFAERQRRERHPYPARVVCGDLCTGLSALSRFDAITIVGSTLAETGDRDQLERAARARLAPDGTLLVAEVGNHTPPPADTVRWLGTEMWIAFRAIR